LINIPRYCFKFWFWTDLSCGSPCHVDQIWKKIWIGVIKSTESQVFTSWSCHFYFWEGIISNKRFRLFTRFESVFFFSDFERPVHNFSHSSPCHIGADQISKNVWIGVKKSTESQVFNNWSCHFYFSEGIISNYS
jgi:hypothetical protein